MQRYGSSLAHVLTLTAEVWAQSQMGLSYFSPFSFYHMRVYRCRKPIVKETLSRPIPIRFREELMQQTRPADFGVPTS